MTNLHALILDELYFLTTPPEVAEAVNMDVDKVLAELRVMLLQGLVKVEDSELQSGSITHNTKLVATKKGLMALHS